MKKYLIVSLFALALMGMAAACNTYQRCPAYTDNAPLQEQSARI